MKRLIRKSHHYDEVTLKDIIEEAGGEQYLKSKYKYSEEVIPILFEAQSKVMDKLFDQGADEVGELDDEIYNWVDNNFDSDAYVSIEEIINKIGGNEQLFSQCKTLEEAEDKMYEIGNQIIEEKEKKYPGVQIQSMENMSYKIYEYLEKLYPQK